MHNVDQDLRSEKVGDDSQFKLPYHNSRVAHVAEDWYSHVMAFLCRVRDSDS